MNTLAKNAAFSLLYRMGNVVFPLLSGMYLARVLTPEALGQVAWVRNTMSYFLLLATMGIPQYALRETARCREEPKALEKLVSELLLLQLMAGMVSLAGYALLLGFSSPGEKLLYGIFSLELLFQLGNIEWLLEGREEYRFIALRSLAVRMASFLALTIFVRSAEDAPRYAFLLCLGTGGNHLLNLFRLHVRLSCRDLDLKRHFDPVFTLMLSSLAASLYSKVDITMLGLLGDNAAVGYYTNGYKVVLLVLTAMTAVTAVFFPRLSRSTPEEFSRHLSAAVNLLLVLAVPASLGLLLVAEELTAVLFGEAFGPAADCMKILSPMVLIRGCGDILCYQAIISGGKEKLLIHGRIWAGIANVLLNALLIPGLGHRGAALATLVSEAVVNGILLPHGLRIGNPRLLKKLLQRILVAGAAMVIVVLRIQKYINAEVPSLILSVMAGITVYGGIVGYSKTKQDLEELYGTEKHGKSL